MTGTRSRSSCARRPRPPLRAAQPLLALAFLLALSPRFAAAEDPKSILLTASGSHLWVVRSDPAGSFTVLYRPPDGPPDTIFRALQASGRPLHVAAWQQTLYIAYADLSVQEIRHRPSENPAISPFHTIQRQPLPRTGLVGFAAGRTGPFALLRHEPLPSTSADAPPTPADPPQRPPLQLLHIVGDGWQPIELPPDLDIPNTRLLAMADPARDHPALISGRYNLPAFHVHRFDGAAWHRQSYDLALQPYAQAVTVRSNAWHDLFLVQRSPNAADQRTVDWLRGGQIHRVGVFQLPPHAVDWWAIGGEGRVSLIAVDRQQNLGWSHLHLGPSDAAPTPFAPLLEADPPAVSHWLSLIYIAAVVIGMLFLFTTARRPPHANLPRLPDDQRPAGFSRILAAFIDITPPILITMWAFDVQTLSQIFGPQLGLVADLADAIPAAMVIFLHVLHTAVTETFTGATLGKLMTGTRVVNLTGGPPNLWQVLARNFFKVIELAAPILLIMPLLSPHRQRLGDLVARTVVISNVQMEDEAEDQT